MSFRYTPYLLPYVASALIASVITIFAWRRRRTPGAAALAATMFSVFWWSWSNAVELASVGLESKIFWASVEYLGIVSLPLGWFSFAMTFTGRVHKLSLSQIALLAIIPLITLLLAWTNRYHGLIRTQVYLDETGSLPIVRKTYGFGFWLYIIYTYILLFFSGIVLLRWARRSAGLYRGQSVALVVGTLLPWVCNSMYVLGHSPIPPLDPSPPAFALSGLAIAWGIFRFRLLDLVPAARDLVIESMTDGLIVLDDREQIVDLNPAATRIIDQPASRLIGSHLAEFLPQWNELAAHLQDTHEACIEIVVGPAEAPPCYYELRVSPLYSREGRLTGRVILLHNITERKLAEQQLLHMSTHDVLTGLYNRAYFQDKLAHLEREGPRPVSILVADMNGLKSANDRYGHIAGDDLLRYAANQLQALFRADDIVARIGGDEFAVLLPGVDAPAVARIQVRLRTGCGEHNSERVTGSAMFSIGAATANAGESLLAAFRRADEAMYRDKRNARLLNGIGMQAPAEEHVESGAGSPGPFC